MNGSLPLPSVTTAAPVATQPGIIDTCTKWYRADNGEDCDTIVQIFMETFTKDLFLQWNPAVGSDCTGLIVDDFYCVGIPETPTTSASPTSKSPLPTNGVGPQPEQPGIPSECTEYWFVGV
jgi:hypothetical protein